MKKSIKSPLVSVIIPTKNNTRTIEKCLQSIKNQTYKNIEIIVVDNHSSDGTLEIAKKFTNKVFTEGPERNIQRRYAVNKAAGNYLFFVDSDMYLSPKVVVECLNQVYKKHVAGVYIPEESIGTGFWTNCKRLERSFYIDIPWMNAARFFSKHVYTQAGGYDKSLVSGEDWDLSQKIEKIGRVSHTSSMILHDEGKISLIKTIQKKLYYAKKFPAYLKQNKYTNHTAKQTSILARYWIFFRNPQKLFRNPVLGLGMLFMKTCEFIFGAIGFIYANYD